MSNQSLSLQGWLKLITKENCNTFPRGNWNLVRCARSIAKWQWEILTAPCLCRNCFPVTLSKPLNMLSTGFRRNAVYWKNNPYKTIKQQDLWIIHRVKPGWMSVAGSEKMCFIQYIYYCSICTSHYLPFGPRLEQSLLWLQNGKDTKTIVSM